MIAAGRCAENVPKVCIARSILGCTNKRYRDARQAAATVERRRADARHTVRNRDARQAAATGECRRTDTRHAIRDRNARQATAILERRRADACSAC